MSDRTAVVGGIVAAAGSGRRLGADGHKALIEIEGVPLVVHAVRRLRAAGVEPVVVVHPPGAAGDFRAALGPDVVLVPGGRRRTDSVRAGLGILPAVAGLVAVHDAARGLCPPAVVAAAIDGVTEGVVAVAPGLPVSDTLKEVADGRVVATVDRRGLWRVQTPQVLTRPVLDAVLDSGAAAGATDELGLVEAAVTRGELDGRIRLVPGSHLATKLTYPRDLVLLRALARGERGREDG